ncbi:MAG: hypothetical protein PHI18_08890, partial [bacterium]|nr:hypothetical protein [bacterium]
MKSRVIFVLAILCLLSAEAFGADCSRRAAIWTQTWTTVRGHFVFSNDSARHEWETKFDSDREELMNAPTDVEFWRG